MKTKITCPFSVGLWNDSLRGLFLSYRSGTWCNHLILFSILIWVLRFFSFVWQKVIVWVTILDFHHHLRPSGYSSIVSLIKKVFQPADLPPTWCFLDAPFCLNSKCMCNSQENSSFWNTQTSPSHANRESQRLHVFPICFM